LQLRIYLRDTTAVGDLSRAVATDCGTAAKEAFYLVTTGRCWWTWL